MLVRTSTTHESPVRRHPPSAILAVVLVAGVLSMQGCDNEEPSNKKRIEPALAEDVESLRDSGKKDVASLHDSEKKPVTNKGGADVEDRTDFDSRCDSFGRQKSNQFVKELRESAPVYYDALVSAFSIEIISHPFCLESRAFLVDRVEEDLAKLQPDQDQSTDEFTKKLNDTVTAQYFDNEKRWEKACESWATRNKQHQLDHLDMVRRVLGLDDSLSDEKLKKEIEGVFAWKPRWEMFSGIAGEGCMRRYTSTCTDPVKAARAKLKEHMKETMGDSATNWLAFSDNPSAKTATSEQETNKEDTENHVNTDDLYNDELVIKHHDKNNDSGNDIDNHPEVQMASPVDDPSGQVVGNSAAEASLREAEPSGLLQKKHRLQQRSLIPVELKPGGSQFLTPRRNRTAP